MRDVVSTGPGCSPWPVSFRAQNLALVRSPAVWLALSLGLAGLSAFGQDTTPPALVSASSLNGRQIGICFNEEMDAASLNQAVNYLVEDAEGIKGVLQAVAQPGNRGVLLDMDLPIAGEFVVTVGFLFDLAGNLLEPGSTVTGRVWGAELSLSDLGTPSPPGVVFSCVEGQMTVRGDGDLINERFDRGTFLQLSRTNDFDVCVRLDNLENVGSPYAGAGLMVRQSLGAGSIQRTILATATNGVNRIYVMARPLGNSLAGHIENGPRIDFFPIWLRLKRTGTSITGFVSRDGLVWEQAGSTFSLPSLPAEALVGLIAASGSMGSAVDAAFRAFGDTVLYPNATISISSPPASVSVEAHNAATLNVTAAVAGAPGDAAQYQWQAETAPGSGVYSNINFANTASLTTAPLAETDAGTHFRVAVYIAGHLPVLSPPALVTVSPDVTGPRVLRAAGTRQLREIILTFSEPLDRATALNIDNYSVDGLVVTNVLIDPSSSLVLLQLAAVQPPGTSNRVQVANLVDPGGHTLSPNPSVIFARAPDLAPGYALRELYYGVSGITVSSLRASPFFPGFPNDLRYVPELEGPNDFLWESGCRLSGFLTPPVSGNYHFWMCSDDQGEFRLSTDADPSHLVLRCREPQLNTYRDFVSTTRRNPNAPENRSQTLFPDGIPLEAGQPYYFEALSKNGVLYGNLSVAWQIPGGPAPTNGSAPIPGQFLSSLLDASRVALAVTQEPADAVYSFADAGGGGARVLLNESFDATDGQFAAALTGDPSGGWVYRPEAGAWTADGSGLSSVPSDKTLTSPPLTVTRSGQVQFDVSHRYSFEYDGSLGWDGGQVRLSVNGGPFLPVPGSAFLSNGYTRRVQGIAGLFGQEAFNGNSPGYESARNEGSSASLGFFATGDVIRVQFLGAWDEATTGSAPNWLIDSVSVTEGLPGGRQVTFAVRATGGVDFALNQAITYQWQRDCGNGFVDIPGAASAVLAFTPTTADAGCLFRCLVGLPGLRLTSEAARLAIPAPAIGLRRENGQLVLAWSEAGRLQQSSSPAGPWSDVSGVIGNTVRVSLDGAQKFFRISVP